ncbi:MAG TPA: hypothetical protein VF773_15935 [Verrucomicrobiae bacterium]
MKTISDKFLESFMSARVFTDKAFLADSRYALPTLHWLCNVFPRELLKIHKVLGQTKWKPEQFDCDDFARTAAAFAAVLHSNTKPFPKCGLAFGEFWYRSPARPENDRDHAINCIVTAGALPADYNLIFFEPQNVLTNQNPIVQLTEEEMNLCLGYRF